VVVLKHGEVVEAGTSLVPSPARPVTVTNPNPTLALPRWRERGALIRCAEHALSTR
jgi:hypothetical protein